MTDPIRETGRVSISGGMANAMIHYGAARQCPECQFGMPKYPGRYPTKCPRCGGVMGGAVSESVPVVCVSRTHRIQGLLEGGHQSFQPYLCDETCSRVITIPYSDLEESGGSEAFKMFLEGPEHEFYYRMEAVEDPVLIFEFDDRNRRMRVFASAEPGRYLPSDPRQEFVVEDHDDTFEDEALSEQLVRMVDIGDSGLDEAMTPITAADLRVFVTEGDAVAAADSYGLALAPSRRMIGESALWVLVHEGTGYALGRGGLPQIDEVMGSGPGGPSYASVTYGPERVRARNRAIDKTHQRVAGAFAEDSRSSARRKRKPGEGPTQIRGGFRLHVGKNKDRKPNKDVQQSLQARLNQRRGLRARIQGAKKWHRSREGQDLHGALARYNSAMNTGEAHDVELRHKIMDVKDRITRYNAGQTRRIGTIAHIGESKLTSKRPENWSAHDIKNAVRLYSFMSMRELRERQRIVRQQQRSAYEQYQATRDPVVRRRLGKAMQSLQIIEAALMAAVNSFGESQLREDFGTLRPRSAGGTEQMTARGPQNMEKPTTEDDLEAILRRLIVTQDLDVLSDVEFDENTGSIYLFFDPVLMPDEIEEILMAIRQERGTIELIATPDMSLPGESVESDWWVVYHPGPHDVGPDPSIYARDPDQYATKIQMVTMAAPDDPAAVAQDVDVAAMIQAAGK